MLYLRLLLLLRGPQVLHQSHPIDVRGLEYHRTKADIHYALQSIYLVQHGKLVQGLEEYKLLGSHRYTY